MPSADTPAPARLDFAVLDVESSAPAPGPPRVRLTARTADGRRLLLDFSGAAVAPPGPSRLTRAAVVALGPASTAGDGVRAWQLQADQGRFDLGAARLFIHEDVTAQATAAVPPHAVPLGKRLLWRAVFLLLATRAGRRWLERRAARA